MKTVAIFNNKGGVGKTTITVLERLAGVIVLVDGYQVELVRVAVVLNRLPLRIQTDTVRGLQLGAYPDIADRLGRIFVHDTTVSRTARGDNQWDFSGRVGACRGLHAPLNNDRRGAC